MTAHVAIVGYGMGNVTSLRNALTAIGVTSHVATTPASLEEGTHVILPGVGAFPLAMENLQRLGFVPALRRLVLDQKRPILGICLGMQLFASAGEEHREAAGLGFVPGRVRRIDAPGLPVPHVGWNETVTTRENHLQTEKAASYYYVHSYHLVPEQPRDVVMTCEHGRDIVAAIERDNVHGVQFHPEKSHAAGLGLLRRFTSL